MSTNEQLIQKADIAVSDLSSGGLLNPEQANTFIRKLLQQPTMLRQARSVVMNAPTRKINKIQFATRIMKYADGPAGGGDAPSGTALASGDRSKPTTDQISLTTKEYIAEVHIPYDVIEDNIERGNIGLATDTGGTPTSGGIASTIMTLMAERAALDLEELAIKGDTSATVDTYLDSADGWLSRFTSNVVDGLGAPISRSLLTDGMKALPSQYRRNRAALRHFVSHEKEIDYRETIAQRETAAGDSQTTSTAPVFAAAAPVEGAALMPDTKGILTNPMNLIWGIQRQVHVETDKDIRARKYIIVLTLRTDFQVEEEEAGVKYTNFAAS
jgi:hypothetical protein